MLNSLTKISFTVVSGCGGLLALESLNVFQLVREVSENSLMRIGDNPIFLLNENPIPFIDLRRENRYKSDNEVRHAVIIRDGKKLSALIVDDILETITVEYTSIVGLKDQAEAAPKFFEGYFHYKDEKALIISSKDLFRLGMPIKNK